MANHNALPWISVVTSETFTQVPTTSKKVKTKDCKRDGKYPVVDQGLSSVSGYVDDESKVIVAFKPVVIFGDHTRVIKWVDYDFVPGADGTKVLLANEFLDARFFYHYLCSIDLPNKGYARHFKYLAETRFLVPPMAEQKQIAAKLDTLLAQVNSIKTRLDTIPAILKRLRQSVLAAAVSGRLTGASASKNVRIQDLADVIGGLTKNAKRKEFDLKRPYLRVANVYENELRLDDIQEIGVQEKELPRVNLQRGDLLIVEGNGSLNQIGRVSIWQDEIDGCVHQNHLIKVRVDSCKLHSFFALYYLMSPQGKSQILSRATSGAGLFTLSISKVSSIEIPLYSVSEQTEIVHRVEQQVNKAQSRVDKLTQAILAKAFRGELTADWRAQNPELISGENSAEALLARIKAEQAKLTLTGM